MKKYPKSLSLFTRTLVAGMVLVAASAQADETPLEGPAYQFASEAYDAFKNGKYDLAATRARQAIQLRPDVPRLRDLLKKAELARQAAATSSTSTAAYKAASKAYAAYEAKNFAGAAQSARQAVRLSTNNKAYWLLLINALAGAGDAQEAQRVTADAVKRFGPDPELVKVQQSLQAQAAFRASERSYGALETGKLDDAVIQARSAVGYLPAAPALHVALINTLVASNRLEEANQAADDMLSLTGPSSEAFLLKAAVSQRRSERGSTQADFDRALGTAGESNRVATRLIAVDAALANGPLSRAANLLDPLQNIDTAEVSVRRVLLTVMSARANAGSPANLTFNFPAVNCTSVADLTMSCNVRPGAAPGDAAFLAADEAYRAFAAKAFDVASLQSGIAIALAPRERNYRLLHIQALAEQGLLSEAEGSASKALDAVGNDVQLLLARAQIKTRRGDPVAARVDYERALIAENRTTRTDIEALAGLRQKEKARERIRAAAATADKALYTDLAYLALAVDDDALASDLFDRADASGELSDRARYDGAFAAARLGNNTRAAAYLGSTVDAAAAGRLSLDAQQVYQTRRAIADLSRLWGVRASLSQRGVAAAGTGIPGGATTDGVEAGAEVYWRPYGIRNGKLLEVYARANATVSGGEGVQSGGKTSQGALGIRVKPLTDTNLIVALERLVPLGSASNSDWLARAGFSSDSGLDLRVDQTSWLSGRIYAEAGHYFQSSQNYATAEGQLGRSFRIGSTGSTLALFPHVVIGGEYDSAAFERQKQAWGAGLGTSARYWFRQDRYTAPQSYADLSVQYRRRLAGDQRAEGWFVRLSMSY